jgi:predicted ATPase
LLPRDELLTALWPDVVVTDGSLARCVSALRAELGSGAHGLIKTVNRRGYIFATPVTLHEPAGIAACSSPQPLPSLAAQPLCGRTNELAELAALMESESLVSIAGPGGIGKTRLALAIALRQRDRSSDGVYLVELALVRDPSLVTAALARALGYPAQRTDCDSTSIAMTMGQRAPLIVLDNCEHVLDAVRSLVATLQRHAPRVRILATSQEPLRVRTERVLHLSSLAVPQSCDLSASEALAYGSIELFCLRARAACPDSRLDEHQVGAVVDICRQLDGSPLAIELAAARLHLLGVDGLRTKLARRLDVLTSGFADALPKHRTLRAALEWSHALLNPSEQQAFDRLGVFVGSFSLDAALQVLGGGAQHDLATLGLMDSLVCKSLVVVERGARTRYRLHESNRLFALEQLSASGGLETARRRHALATQAVIEAIDRHVWVSTGPSLQAEFEPELGNLRVALSWALGASGDSIIAIGLATAALWLWDSLGLAAEGIAYLVSLRTRLSDETPRKLQAAYWRALILQHHGIGPAPHWLEAARKAVDLTRETADASVLYEALVRAVIILSRAGITETAERYLIEAQTLEELGWPTRKRATGRFARAEYLEAADRLEEARQAQEERLAMLLQDGQHGLCLHAQSQLVMLSLATGDSKGAVERGRRALQEPRAGWLPFRSRLLQLAVAEALLVEGQLRDATELVDACIPLLRLSDAAWQALDLLALVWAERGDAPRAARLLASADKHHRLFGFERKPHRARNRARLFGRLAVALPDVALVKACAEGEALKEGEAIALATTW